MTDRVRRAVPEDAAALYEVHRVSWLETYAGLVDAAQIEERFSNAELWRGRWAGLIANADVRVAERDGRVVGWCYAIRMPEDDVTSPRSVELEGIYLLAEAHGSGLGQALLDAVLGEAPAFLWVADGNPRAEAFYRRNGFDRDGAVAEHPVTRGGASLRAVRMVR
jgi:GNAT superfamily N-acetyltransferase